MNIHYALKYVWNVLWDLFYKGLGGVQAYGKKNPRLKFIQLIYFFKYFSHPHNSFFLKRNDNNYSTFLKCDLSEIKDKY